MSPGSRTESAARESQTKERLSKRYKEARAHLDRFKLPKERPQGADSHRPGEDFRKALKALALTKQGELVIEGLLHASGVWLNRPLEGQSMDNFLGRRDIGLLILKGLK